MIDRVQNVNEGCFVLLNKKTEDGLFSFEARLVTGWIPCHSKPGRWLMASRGDKAIVECIDEDYIEQIMQGNKIIYNK